MKTKIVSAFPGLGKTYYCKNNPQIAIDLDSSTFSWLQADGQTIRNPNFPLNYIEHVKKLMGQYQFVLVSSHKEVREALRDHNLDFYLIYPTPEMKEEYLQRMIDRGNTRNFINLIAKNWDAWLKECREFPNCIKIETSRYLSDEIQGLI